MRPSYFVIELSTRWLIALVVALALSLIMAFAFGYGAAWSVLSSPIDEQPDTIVASPTPTPIEERIGTTPTPKTNIQPTATATATPRQNAQPTAKPTAKPTQTPRVIPTKTPTVTPVPVSQRPKPTATATVEQPASGGFYVQVLAGSVRSSLGASERKLADLGFDSSRQHIMVSTLGNGEELFKLRIGPFPDRESADRVANRMRNSGFKDAWVAAP